METTPQSEDDLKIYTFNHYTLAILLRLQIKSNITATRCLSLAIAPLWLEIYNSIRQGGHDKYLKLLNHRCFMFNFD